MGEPSTKTGVHTSENSIPEVPRPMESSEVTSNEIPTRGSDLERYDYSLRGSVKFQDPESFTTQNSIPTEPT